MTRKRQNVEQVEAPVAPKPKKSFPSKDRGGGYSKKQSYSSQDFDKQYGYVGGTHDALDNYGVKSEVKYEDYDAEGYRGDNEPENKESVFPTEITSYLKGMAELLETEKDLDKDFFEKCALECVGTEVKLLSFRDSATVVERVFGQKPFAATLFLQSIANQKHKTVVDLMFGGCSARTLEKLIYSSTPINPSSVDILSKFVDLLCDNWNEAIITQPSSYLLRCIGRVTCGLGPIEVQANKFAAAKPLKPKFYNAAMKESLPRIFSQIADRLFDAKITGPHWDNLFCSVVLQAFLEADAAVGGKRADALIENALSNWEESEIIKKLQGKESSRVWDCALTFCTDKGIKLFWDKVGSANFKALVYHPNANFPIQRLLSSVKSNETATTICSVVIPMISTLLAEKRPGVVTSLLKCCLSHPDLEESALKELRKHFNTETNATKEHFLFNVLTMNPQNGSASDLSKCQYHGSMIVQELFKFTKIKTLSANVSALSDATIVEMAFHKIASHVIQAVLNSATVGDELKNKVIQALESKFVALINNPIGSHVFECIWDSPLFKVAKKQDLMKSFVPIRTDTKFWKFAMLRCDMNLFRSDRKGWVKKQQSWKKPQKNA